MVGDILKGRAKALAACFLALVTLAGCASSSSAPPSAEMAARPYLIGPGDTLQVFIWHNQDLSLTAPVRPDGKISIPLVNDVPAAGKTPTELASVIQDQLKKYVNDPVVTVIVSSFTGPYSEQIRIVGQAEKPQSLSYRSGMTVLDAMIAVGGLTQYASGNRAKLVRSTSGKETAYSLRLSDLLQDGDITANTPLQPGDMIIIPQTYF
jgi:polysaccharide export outer membrane protein